MIGSIKTSCSGVEAWVNLEGLLGVILETTAVVEEVVEEVETEGIEVEEAEGNATEVETAAIETGVEVWAKASVTAWGAVGSSQEGAAIPESRK